MKKAFIGKIITVMATIAFLFSIVACRNETLSIHDKAGPVRLTLTAEPENDKALTITGSAPDPADLYWTYTATKMDDGLALGEQRSPVYVGRMPFSLDLSAGEWQIYTRGYRDEYCREMVYDGFGNKTLTGTDNMTITVSVHQSESRIVALNPADVPKKTADIVLLPVLIDLDPEGTAVRHMVLKVSNTPIASWSLVDNVWIDDADSGPIPAEGRLYETPIGKDRTVALIVTEEDESLVAGEGWRKVSLSANCTYVIQGTVTAVPGDIVLDLSVTGPGDLQASKRTAIVSDVFDVIPSGTPDYAFLYAWADCEGTQLDFPFTAFVEGEWHSAPYSPEELGLQPVTSESGFNLNTEEAWVGKSASSNNAATSNYNQKLRKARFAAGSSETHKAALSGYTQLTEATVAEGITTLADYTFNACPLLVSVTLPKGLATIGQGAFRDCASLETLDLPSTVTTLGASAFKGCSKMKSINLPEGITQIPAYAFEDCSALDGFTIPSTVTSIGYYAFNRCSALKTVKIPVGVTVIDTNTFSGCTSLKTLTIPDTVTSINSRAFQNCTSLASVTIPTSVRYCQSQSFMGCTALTNVTLNEGITLLGNEMFSGCTSLRTITIPNSVTNIGTDMFAGCTSLETIYVRNYRGLVDFSNAGVPEGTQILFYGEY